MKNLLKNLPLGGKFTIQSRLYLFPILIMLTTSCDRDFPACKEFPFKGVILQGSPCAAGLLVVKITNVEIKSNYYYEKEVIKSVVAVRPPDDEKFVNNLAIGDEIYFNFKISEQYTPVCYAIFSRPQLLGHITAYSLTGCNAKTK